MGENSKIEWCHHTFNPWRGCTKISDGCKNCYAEKLSHRNPATLGVWGDNGTRVVAVDNYWKQPLKWDRESECNCGAAGRGGQKCDFCAGGCIRPRVFCASLADVFEDRDDLIDARHRLMLLIEKTPNLDWLLLTKRPENVGEMVPVKWFGDGFPENLWLGTSVENQEQADKRIPELLKIPAKIHFLSMEPLLGDVKWLCAPDERSQPRGVGTDYEWRPKGCIDTEIEWVIVGGESGPNARPMNPDWVRSIRDYCNAARVPFFFKQWGGTNKKSAGRLLDGQTWDELPTT